MTGADAVAASVAELAQLTADALGEVGRRSNAAVRAQFEKQIAARDFTYRPAELAAAVRAAVLEWADEMSRPSTSDGSTAPAATEDA